MILTEELVLKRSKAENLVEVQRLNCWGCQLTDVSLLERLPNLEVLNLSCNDLSSLKDLQMCQNLKELYVRRNQLEDFYELEHLKALPTLKEVWLSGNPLCSEPNYKRRVITLLPQIVKLDGVDITKERNISTQSTAVNTDITKTSTTGGVLQAILLLLAQLDREGLKSIEEVIHSMLGQE